MKKILGLILVSGLLLGCQGKNDKAPGAPDGKGNASYAFGMDIGNSLKAVGLKIEYDQFLSGMKDVLEGNTPKMTENDARTLIQSTVRESQKRMAEEASTKEKAYLDSNKTKNGVKVTASGLQYEVLKEGTGPKPQVSDTVKVDYVGKLLDGTVFDSSIERKEPATFPLGGVIPGWTEGLQLMTVGSKYRFTIPSQLAYGPQGAGGKIPPNATLIFEVDLLEIVKQDTTQK